MQINKIQPTEIYGRKSKKSTFKKDCKNFIKNLLIVSVILLPAIYIYNNYTIVNKSPVETTDRYIDCVNLGQCEDLTTDTAGATPVIENKLELEISPKIKDTLKSKIASSKLGELTTHKGVYVNKAILDAIDEKFTPADAKKLKVIMLAECAKDYKVDGIASYECRSKTQNKNTNNTWDCGYLQINSKKPCTEKDYTIEHQITMAYKKLNNIDGEVCGEWKCWSSYKFKDSKTITTSYNMWNNK